LSNTLPIDTVRLVLIIYALLAIPIKIYVIKKEAAYPIFSLYVYLTLYFFTGVYTNPCGSCNKYFFISSTRYN
jgi:hypothetical protein